MQNDMFFAGRGIFPRDTNQRLTLGWLMHSLTDHLCLLRGQRGDLWLSYGLLERQEPRSIILIQTTGIFADFQEILPKIVGAALGPLGHVREFLALALGRDGRDEVADEPVEPAERGNVAVLRRVPARFFEFYRRSSIPACLTAIEVFLRPQNQLQE